MRYIPCLPKQYMQHFSVCLRYMMNKLYIPYSLLLYRPWIDRLTLLYKQTHTLSIPCSSSQYRL